MRDHLGLEHFRCRKLMNEKIRELSIFFPTGKSLLAGGFDAIDLSDKESRESDPAAGLTGCDGNAGRPRRKPRRRQNADGQFEPDRAGGV